MSQPDLAGDADQRRERRDLRARRPDAGHQVGEWEEHAAPGHDHLEGHRQGKTWQDLGSKRIRRSLLKVVTCKSASNFFQ